jgi:hypothetical protein
MCPSHTRILRLLSTFVLLGVMRGHAQDIATLTLLKDTPLRVIRGVSVLQGVEGMRVRQGDYLETGPGATAQAQLEFAGGAIVELGPSSQVLLFNATAGSAEIVVATGWLKGETNSGTYRYDSPLISATTKGGNVLLHVTDDESDVFVETGVASVSSGAPAPIATSAEKIFFTRRAGKPVATAGRPSQEFVSAMPVSFRDVLPPRFSRFEGRKPPEAKSDHEVSYSEIERLLRLPAAWRKGLVDRFRPRLQDHGFRQAIEAHITALPEWKPVLSADNLTSGAAPTDKSDPR